MLLNTAILGVIFLILCLGSLGGFVTFYNHESSLRQLIFGVLLYVSIVGMGICFVTAIVLMIIGG